MINIHKIQLPNIQDLLDKILYDERYRWIGHFGFWILMFANEIFGLIGLVETDVHHERTIYNIIINMVVVYYNLYFLIPKFLKNEQFYQYLFWSFGSLIVGMYFSYYPFRLFLGWEDVIPYTLGYMGETLGVLGAAVAFRIIKNNIDNQTKINDLERLKKDTELRFLKDQVNPHFLFNNLNNIYVQARTSPNEVPNSIMQLSDLLRYQLYKAAKEKVPLTQEIEFIKNYIGVEVLRREHLNADVEINGNSRGIDIAPLLFLPFVENVFKHGDFSDPSRSLLKIVWDIESHKIIFSCTNSKNLSPKDDSLDGGIGLENVKRRLDILYANNYDLKINNLPESFEILLTLNQITNE